MKIRIGDQVIVNTGKDRGKTGSVLKLDLKRDRVQVDGVNSKFRHIKAREGQPGEKVEFFAPLHVSNVSLIDPKSGKATRVGYEIKDGVKTRMAKASGQAIVKSKAAKAEKPAEAKASKKEPKVIEA